MDFNLGMITFKIERAMLETPGTSFQQMQTDGPRLMLKIQWQTCTMDIKTVSCSGPLLFINSKTLEEVLSVLELLVVLSGQVDKISNIKIDQRYSIFVTTMIMMFIKIFHVIAF